MKLPKFGKDKSTPSPGQQRVVRRREMLDARPVRNPNLEWREQDDSVVLHIERAKTWKTSVINFFVPIPSERDVVLDAIGADVWKMLDGQNTMAQISKALAKKYQLSSREAEISLQQFFKELGRRGYVAFVVPPEDEKKPDAAKKNRVE